MHAISFRLKRAHLQAVAFARRAVAKIPGMTPARFDALYALRRVELTSEFLGNGGHWDESPFGKGLHQTELTARLGLARSTVSKLLKRLEQLGWIKRVWEEADRRTKYVTLTREGLRRIWRAMRRVFRGRILLHSYEDLFNRIRDRDRHVIDAINDANDLIDDIGRHFGDVSTLEYEFGEHPDH